MTIEIKPSGKLHSYAEDLFMELFCEAFGPEKSQYLFIQYPFVDIYGKRRSIDFALQSAEIKIAVEVDGERYHNPGMISSNKYYDDLLKQNSLIYDNWKVYRWAYNQLRNQPEKVKDELITFLGEIPMFSYLDDYMPKQKGKIIELKDHQQKAINNLEDMRNDGESIALLYHATGTGKTVTAVSDAKKVGERTLFLAHTKELVMQAKETFDNIWKDKKTVVFCASVAHAMEIAKLFRENDIRAESVSGSLRDSERKRILKEYEYGNIDVLCACDLLNEGWDSPRTEVLFMARPTMSKTLYLQQLGRGMRLYEGKEYLMVFDFIDNASLFNMPYSLHRIFNINEYKPGEYVVASNKHKEMDRDLIGNGEKPSVYLDFPIDVTDYELIDLFNWQEEVKNMISQIEFVRMVDVQTETIERYIREGKIEPDLEVPMGTYRSFKYFKKENIYKYAQEFGWELITPANMKDKFMNMIEVMDMSYSYKPVLLKAMFKHLDESGKVMVEDIVDYFIDFYKDRKEKGLPVEKKNSVYCKDNYTRKDVERNIFSNPFKRFEDMRFMERCKEIEYVEFNRHIFKKLTSNDIKWIIFHCDKKIEEYYNRPIFKGK